MADLKRNDNIKFNYKGKEVTGTILHSTKAKTRIWLHEDRNDHQITYLEAKGSNFQHSKVKVSELPDFIREKVVSYASIEKGDLVSFVDDGEELRGLVGSITAKGITVNLVNSNCSVPWSYALTKVDSNVDEQSLPIDDWTAKQGYSSTPYHDGGKCQKYTIFHKGKKALEAVEGAWGGGYEVKTFGTIDGQDPAKLLEQAALESFKLVGISDNKRFYAESAECVAQWLVIRNLVCLKDHFDKQLAFVE